MAGRNPDTSLLALVREDVDAALARALEAGCGGLNDPHDEPRGQGVAYVRDSFVVHVELASPIKARVSGLCAVQVGLVRSPVERWRLVD